jgi:hypothetical protein
MVPLIYNHLHNDYTMSLITTLEARRVSHETSSCSHEFNIRMWTLDVLQVLLYASSCNHHVGDCISKDHKYDVRKIFDTIVEILKRTYSSNIVWKSTKKIQNYLNDSFEQLLMNCFCFLKKQICFLTSSFLFQKEQQLYMLLLDWRAIAMELPPSPPPPPPRWGGHHHQHNDAWWWAPHNSSSNCNCN